MGELLVEFPRREIGRSLEELGSFIGPFPAGAPAIFADTVAKLKHTCGFIGVVGKDDFGKLLIRKLKDDGVDVSKIRVVDGYATGTSFVTYFEDGSRKFLFHLRHSAAAQLSTEDIDPAYISKVDLLHVMGSALSVSDSIREACYRAVEVAKENKVRVSFDPNVRPELMGLRILRETCKPVLENCDLFLPNTEEIKLLTAEKDLEGAARKLLDFGIETIAIKLGKNGSMLVTGEGRINIPPFRVEEVDPTGAGDSFDGGFVCALLEGKSPKEAALFANAVGALSVTKRGGMGGIPTREEVENLMSI